MARLTPAQVRVRAAVLIVLVLMTFVLLILGMFYAGGSDWFYFLIFVIDLPAVAILLVVDWAQRART